MRNKKRSYRNYFFSEKEVEGKAKPNALSNLLNLGLQKQFQKELDNIQNPNILYQKHGAEEDKKMNEEMKEKMEGI